MQNSATNNFIRGLSVQTIATGTYALLQLCVFAIFSRILSREDFGYYAALMGVITIISCLSDTGIGSSIIQKKETCKEYLSTALILSVIIGCTVSTFAFFLSPYIATSIADSTLILPLEILSITVALYSLQAYATSVLRKSLKFKVVGICRVVSYLFSSIIGFIYAYWKGGLYSLVVLYLCDSIVYTILLFSHVKISFCGYSKEYAKQIVAFGGWLTLGVIATNISSQLDRLLLGRLIGIKRLGEYNRPSGFIMNLIGMLNTIFDTVLFPILSNFQDSQNSFRNLLYRSTSLLNYFGILLGCLLFFNSDAIILLFFGSEWIDMIPIMQITSISTLFMLNNTLADCFYRSFNMVKYGFYIRLIGIFLSIFLLLLGTQFGIKGVAVSVLFSNLLIVFIKIAILSRKSEANLSIILKGWFVAWTPSIPLVLILLPFIMLQGSSLTFVIIKLVISITIPILEILYIPKLFGQEFYNLIYPKIRQVVKR